ncbi:MAG: NAD-dependent DNA ligase LigA, partial [Patescibacteria group bacterium]
AIPLELRAPTQQEIAAFLKKYPDVNTRTFRSRLPARTGTIEVRGEVFMRKDVFEKLNREQKKKGLPLFANPRNVSAGSIRQLDPKIAAQRMLDFFGYALMDEESFGITTHEHVHELIRLLGIKTNPREEYCAGHASVVKYHESIQKERERFPYWSDGIVVTVNNNAAFKKLGVVGKTPRGSIAFKFPAQQATTVLREVHFQVGRTGALTPVATFEPVALAGTIVTHATLHNSDEIERLDVRIGDTVIIEKAGDVIPKVIRVVREMRTGNETTIPIPKNCPVCDFPTVRRADEVALYCSNKQCFAQEKERITHFVSKKAFDIDGLGEKIVEQLIGQGLIHDPADLFTLKRGDLEPLERFAEKSASNLIEAIAARKKIELPRFLFALGIRHVGEETAYDLAQHFGTIKEIRQASQEDFERVPNIGSVVAQSLFQYFRDEKQKEYIEKLMVNGVETTSVGLQKKPGACTGKTFVVTGTLSSMTREEAREAIREHGGNVSSSVSKQTDYVVVGEDPGSKYDRAKKLGVTQLSEDEFLVLLNSSSDDIR